MERMNFEAHGEFEISLKGEIVIIQFFHNWNLEGAQKFFNEYKDVVLKNNLKRYGVLSNLSKFEGGTPEAMSAFTNIAEWAVDHGQRARALVLDSGYKKYTIDRIDKGKARFPVKTFHDEEEAASWLVSLGLSDS